VAFVRLVPGKADVSAWRIFVEAVGLVAPSEAPGSAPLDSLSQTVGLSLVAKMAPCARGAVAEGGEGRPHASRLTPVRR